MKTEVRCCAVAFLAATVIACGQSATAPTTVPQSAPTVSGVAGVGAIAPQSMNIMPQAAASAPFLVRVGGFTDTRPGNPIGITDGRVDMSCGRAFNNRMVVNDTVNSAFVWQIRGQFGANKGAITIDNVSLPIASWTSTEIAVYPTTALLGKPYDIDAFTANLKVTTAGGSVMTSVPAVGAYFGRIGGQCAWYVAVMRRRLGAAPSPTAYGNYTAVTASWVPARADQLQVNGTHTWIITSVSGPVTNKDQKTWTVTMSEDNRNCDNRVTPQFADTFVVSGTGGNARVVRYLRMSNAQINVTSFYR